MNLNSTDPKDKIVLALDVSTAEEALKLVKELKDYAGIFKIGLQLFMSEGFDVVKRVQDEGVEIFFDVKLHDIPNTVAQASVSIVRNGINFFNIHCTGSAEMMTQSAAISQEIAMELNKPAPTILGVTVLSSLNQNILMEELGIGCDINDMVVRLAKLSKNCGLTGVVASVLEAGNIRKACGEDFVILCPGIRPSFAAKNDQQRIATPAQAIEAGANLLVLGRAVTSADDKILAMKRIHKEIADAL